MVLWKPFVCTILIFSWPFYTRIIFQAQTLLKDTDKEVMVVKDYCTHSLYGNFSFAILFINYAIYFIATFTSNWILLYQASFNGLSTLFNNSESPICFGSLCVTSFTILASPELGVGGMIIGAICSFIIPFVPNSFFCRLFRSFHHVLLSSSIQYWNPPLQWNSPFMYISLVSLLP